MLFFIKCMLKGILLTSFFLVQVSSTRAAEVVSPEMGTGFSEIKSGTAEKFMVVAANPLAAEAGAKILRMGGTAVDAAIAVQLVLNLVEPQSSGIGGGAFVLHWDAKSGKLASYDGRETAPASALENRFLTENRKVMSRKEAMVGGKSVGVPGVLRLMEMIHRRHGKLPWADLFSPAISLAKGGFAISPRLHQLLSRETALKNIEPASSFYYDSHGNAKSVGTVLKNRQFARTLQVLAEKGSDAFYEGPIAADIIRTVVSATNNPSDMTLEDMAGYKSKERPAVCGMYRSYRVCGMGPPSSGGIGVIQTLGILEPFDLRAMGRNSATAIHLIVEAGRLAFADRAVYIADSDVVPVPTKELIKPEYLKQRSGLLDPLKSMSSAEAGVVLIESQDDYYKPAQSPELPSTTHFSIVDVNGNAVAMTSTIENAFGSRLMVNGFLLNNQLTDFSYQDVAENRKVANRVQGGKRPRSSMAPTLVFNSEGKLEMILGSPGGPAIVGFVVKTLVGLIDWDMTPAQATASPFALSFGGSTLLEKGFSAQEDALKALGHKIHTVDFPSGIHAIRITDTGLLIGGADPRREGTVAGE
ncbi:MAG TPA: gamma-glutamyltransferase [Rhodospirillaceae bacterium]|nr:gamma-glutamyltransferase [Candidatus Neomarinimicrobiota bacterium]HCX14135.1 gamma-glutamyltransferase [Rhodospirillaceae bacterium]